MAFPPQRIVSLLSSATEILFGIGVGERVVGIGHECDWPREATNRLRVTRSWIDSERPSCEVDKEVRERLAAGLPLYEVDVERLARLAPDLIVTQAQCDVCAVRYDDVIALVEGTPSLQGTRVVALAPQSLADIFSDIRRIGEATAAQTAAESYLAGLTQRVEFIQQKSARLPRRKTICIEWTEPLMLAANWTPTLIEIAGGHAGLVQADAHSTYADWQQVVEYDPEAVIISPCGFDLARSRKEAASLVQLPGWAGLSAVREGRVYLVDGNAYLNRSGPRIVDSLEILAHAIHPEVFPPSEHEGWERFDIRT